MNLFDITKGPHSLGTGPRDATAQECDAYLVWLASERGISIPDSARYLASGIWHDDDADAVCVLEMPGYGAPPLAIMETLDEAGEVVRSVPLALDNRGKLVMSAKQIADATGLKAVRKTRKTATKPVEPREAIAALLEPSAPDIALVARVAALEAAFARMGLSVPDAAPIACNDNAAAPRRTERERKAIIRAWRMRGEMRARADLDRRALEAANGAYRGALDVIRAANDDRDSAAARAADMERIALSYEADAQRAVDDLRGARAEAAALARRLENTRAATTARKPLPMPPPSGAFIPPALAAVR